ncbi:hypothetical protein EOT10_03145 [Streptomyces antnestii]|uniref:Uncharacterized protein n=1 Tax=Streptomyces antnestii TaxID=2494256 RepID=A0A437Q322_9ACTN|nr:hypothetical protein [Streptomyces sp. San01]RVU28871.1 hypothetical protein EOT10_03145 [Streptomyces sp. San01]
MRGHLTRATAKLFLLVALLGLVTPTATAAAQPAQVARTRTVVLALNGTFSAPAEEPIHITGRIRVTAVSQGTPGGGGTLRVISSLDNTTGIGQISGRTYRFVGADVTTRALPSDPITPVIIRPRFLRILPGDPILPTDPIRVAVKVAGDGAISSISADIGPT